MKTAAAKRGKNGRGTEGREDDSTIIIKQQRVCGGEKTAVNSFAGRFAARSAREINGIRRDG